MAKTMVQHGLFSSRCYLADLVTWIANEVGVRVDLTSKSPLNLNIFHAPLRASCASDETVSDYSRKFPLKND